MDLICLPCSTFFKSPCVDQGVRNILFLYEFPFKVSKLFSQKFTKHEQLLVRQVLGLESSKDKTLLTFYLLSPL